MATTTTAPKKTRAPKSQIARERTRLAMLENGLNNLPEKWQRELAQKKAKLEEQRKLVELLENGKN